MILNDLTFTKNHIAPLQISNLTKRSCDFYLRLTLQCLIAISFLSAGELEKQQGTKLHPAKSNSSQFEMRDRQGFPLGTFFCCIVCYTTL